MANEREISKVTLYSYWRSTAAWRVRIALGLKGIPYNYKAINLLEGQQKSAEYAEINPQGLLPTIIIEYVSGESVKISQSLAIIEYLDECFPGPALLPACPRDRALTRQLSLIIACDTHPLQNLSVLKTLAEEDKKKRAQFVIENGLCAYEKYLSGDCKYSVGDVVTMADLVLVPQVFNAHRWGVDMSKFPLIAAKCAMLDLIPQFIAAHPTNQPDAQ